MFFYLESTDKNKLVTIQNKCLPTGNSTVVVPFHDEIHGNLISHRENFLKLGKTNKQCVQYSV